MSDNIVNLTTTPRDWKVKNAVASTNGVLHKRVQGMICLFCGVFEIPPIPSKELNFFFFLFQASRRMVQWNFSSNFQNLWVAKGMFFQVGCPRAQSGNPIPTEVSSFDSSQKDGYKILLYLWVGQATQDFMSSCCSCQDFEAQGQKVNKFWVGRFAIAQPLLCAFSLPATNQIFI